MAGKSEYVILRMVPDSSGMIVAKNGLDSVKDAKTVAQDLAMENPEVVFIPAVLYDVAYAKEIRNTQITEPPEQVMNLLGFAEALGADAAGSGEEEGGGSDNESGSDDESGNSDESGDDEAPTDAAPAATGAQSSGELF